MEQEVRKKRKKRLCEQTPLTKKKKESRMMQNMFSVWQGKTHISSAPVHHFMGMANTLLPRYSHWEPWHKARNSILSTNSSSEAALSSIIRVFIKNSWYLCCAFIQNSWYLCWQFPALVQQPAQFVKGFIAPNAAINLVTAQLSLEDHTPLAS